MEDKQYVLLPLTEDLWQSFTLTLSINGDLFYARVEVRYLPAPAVWVLSVWDHVTGELLVNMVKLVCSYVHLNDLMLPFAGRRDGAGMGSLFVIRRVDAPATPDPSKGNLTEFRVLWGDSIVQPGIQGED